MHQVNEFAQSVAASKREASDRPITVTVTSILFVLCVAAFKYAIGG